MTGDPKQRTGSQSSSAPVVGVATAVGLGGLAPLLLILMTPSTGYPAWPGAVLIMVISGLRFAWIVSSKQRHLFEMTTWLFVYVFLGTAPLVQLRLAVDPSTTPDIYHELDDTTVALVCTGAIALMTGSFIAARKETRPRAEPREISHTKVRILAIVSLAIGAAYIALVGLGAVLGSRADLSLARAAVWSDPTINNLVQGAVSMSLLVSVVAQLQVRRESKLNGMKTPILLLGASFVTLFVCVNPLSSPRYVFGTVLLGVLAALGIYGTLGRYRAVSLGAVIALIVLFPLADLFRMTLDSEFQFENPLVGLVGGDFDSFAQINNAVLFVERSGITWGNQLLGALLFFVPRSVWPGKAVDTGVLLAESREYGFTNLSAPLWAELYINGGWVLLILGMALVGFTLRRWDEAADDYISKTAIPPILSCIAPFYLLIILRGSLLQSLAYIAVVLACTLFVTRRRERPRISHHFPSSRTGNQPRPSSTGAR